MIAAALVCLLFAAVCGVCAGLSLAARLDDDETPARPVDTTPEWLAVLAATDTPIFAEVWADSLRRDLKEL